MSNDSILAENNVILRGDHGTLFDIGDGVACLQFHSPANAISEKLRIVLEESITEVEENFRGMVLSSIGPNFCVGGNLKYLLQVAESGDWAAAEYESKKLHDTFMRIKYCTRPIIAAPFANTLGGGVEMCLHCSGIQAVEKIRMGLVEFTVGLIPGAGGVKEITVRNFPSVMMEKVFSNLIKGKVFLNASDAIENGYISKTDRISIDPENQIDDAKKRVLEMYADGYKKPAKATVRVIGESGMSAIINKCDEMQEEGILSSYDYYIAKKLIYIMQGGALPEGSVVDEEYLLKMEREVFVGLLGQEKTRNRMSNLIKTGKPLRN